MSKIMPWRLKDFLTYGFTMAYKWAVRYRTLINGNRRASTNRFACSENGVPNGSNGICQQLTTAWGIPFKGHIVAA
jgi:hypothetical protein